MADKEHRALTGESLHDLKGVESANNYKVPVAINGASDWRKLDHNSLTTTGNPFGAQLLHVKDVAAAGTNGGTLTKNVWNNRTLDTVVTNEISGTTLNASVITLPAGTYYAKIKAPGYNVGHHKARLLNTTNNTVLVTSEGAYAPDSTIMSWAEGEGRFTISGTKKIRLQHQCTVTNAGDGGGLAADIGQETYGQVWIWKIS